MGWSCSEGITESLQSSTSSFSQRFGKLKNSSGPGGIVYKNVMAKTRREKGKDSELQVGFDTLVRIINKSKNKFFLAKKPK